MTDILQTDLSLNIQDRSLFSDRSSGDIKIYRGDTLLASGRKNMAQSILSRLLTRAGELSDIGHPDYGSRLYTLIGEPNSERTRALAEFYIREALLSEERIEEIVDIIIDPPSPQPDKRNMMEIKLAVLLKEDPDPMSVSMEYNL